ncbi:MAG: exopolysaccharide biosynthesis protein [Alphaproteobacteria bacterium]|nr:exopolysaccharide biosynthesis protein [Alphaproteobacteria bacterium]
MNDPKPTEKNRLSDLLANYAAAAPNDRVSLEDIVRLLENRSLGALLLLFALPMALPVPTPGLSAIFGVPLIFISAQLIMGNRQVWFPAWLARKTISRAQFAAIVRRVVPILKRLELILKPRAVWLCGKWAVVPIGIACTIMAAMIALPVPFGNVVPGVAVSLFALGLIQHDGLAVALGFLVSVLAVVIVWAAILGAHAVIQSSWPF